MIVPLEKIDISERKLIFAIWDRLTYTQQEEVKAGWSPLLPAGWIGHDKIKVIDRQPTGDLIVTLPASR